MWGKKGAPERLLHFNRQPTIDSQHELWDYHQPYQTCFMQQFQGDLKAQKGETFIIFSLANNQGHHFSSATFLFTEPYLY